MCIHDQVEITNVDRRIHVAAKHTWEAWQVDTEAEQPMGMSSQSQAGTRSPQVETIDGCAGDDRMHQQYTAVYRITG